MNNTVLSDHEPKVDLMISRIKYLLISMICIIVSGFYFYGYLLRVIPSLIPFDLIKGFSFSATKLSNLSAIYYYVYAPMQLVVGFLLDYLGAKRVLSAAILCCAVGAYLSGFQEVLFLIELGRVMIGLGSSFALVGAMYVVSFLIPKRYTSLAFGLIIGTGMLGGMLGDLILGQLIRAHGWYNSLSLLAIIGLVLAVTLFSLMSASSKYTQLVVRSSLREFRPLRYYAAVKRLLLSRQIWINGIVGGLLYLPISVFAELWGINYVRSIYQLDYHQAAWGIGMMFLGFAIGAPFFGWLSDCLQQRVMLLTAGCVSTIILFSMLIYLPGFSFITLNSVLFMLGFFASTQVLVFVVGRESAPSYLPGAALSITNMFVMLGGVLCQPLIGFMLDLTWDGRMIGHVRLYSATGYQFALSMLPLGIMIALLLTFLLSETYPRIEKDKESL